MSSRASRQRRGSGTGSSRIALAIHGGAGTMPRTAIRPQREQQIHAALADALRAGYERLSRGESSIDAVTAAVIVLEDSPLFNAGHGAVFNAEREHELDAAVMSGRTRAAGAVAAIRRARNPVAVARAVMERSTHVLLAGEGADAFARSQGLECVAPEYFSTRSRLIALERVKRMRAAGLAKDVSAAERHGTVGAVALDRNGDLAAATSTGGMTDKLRGRIGDSPIIGAGTYADNATCAVSATGDGEFFIRSVLAYDLSARMRYRGESLAVASRKALAGVAKLGGSGGLIAVDRSGRVALPFNSEGMYRGYVTARGEIVTRIFGDR